MSNIKHSKYKNTYLLYEFLIRQTTTDIINGTTLADSSAFKLIKEHFSKGILKKELKVYNTLLKESVITEDDKSAGDFLLNEICDFHNSLNQNLLNRAKYNLVKEIKRKYQLESLVNTRIPEYKDSATVYLFLEANRKKDFLSKTKFRKPILETLSKRKLVESEQIADIFEGYDSDEIKLAYHILVKRFNTIVENKLNENQKKFIKDFIYQTTDESEWVNNHVVSIKKSLTESAKRLTSKTDNEKLLKLKINEVTTNLQMLEKKKIYSDSDYEKILLYYQLLEELK